MQENLDNQLCEKYPKMLVNRHASMQQTAMCWGFSCGDGWYNILNQLMANIQHHIDWSVKQRDWAVKYNEIASQAKAGNFDLFDEENAKLSASYREERLAEIIAADFRTVPEVIPQVTLDQVKEKFGTLRFYYTGGDDYISGLVSMAESMSGVTCEECGSPGKTHGGGWVRTLCDEHEAERQETLKKRMAEYDAGKSTV
jgi:hypothetical protein